MNRLSFGGGAFRSFGFRHAYAFYVHEFTNAELAKLATNT